ncbi:MAG: glutamine-hydrolyzing GMP synthase [Candidatus Krumholzibacteriia bacterium]
MEHDAIAVVDFGGQYAHLIATKVRRHRVLAEIVQPEDPLDVFARYRGIILSGSPALASAGEESAYNTAIYDLLVPILGFCFGHQEIAKHYGGQVIHGRQEWGRSDLHLLREHPLYAGLGPVEQVWMSHFDSVTALGPDFFELGFTTSGEGGEQHRFAAIGSDRHLRYGFQYHPEVDDTVHGDAMIGNFVLNICGCRPTWTLENFVETQVESIRAQVGARSVFLLASGGVDSTVAARLFGEALGPDRLHLLHVDNGLMRKDESRAVLQILRDLGLDRHLHFVDASDVFLAALAGVTEPERKRRIIGDTFIEVFESEARRLGIEDHLLGQGTIYPDTIETGGTKRADTIKTHHNRVPIIQEMIDAGKVVEPLADLYKVEVRELGELLGIPRDLVWRHPFPGPGLGVRLLCSDGRVAGADVLERAAPAVEQHAAQFGLEGTVLPLRSVGVKADLRSYEHPVLLQPAASGDQGRGPGAGGAGANLPRDDAGWERLDRAMREILKSTPGVNRCLLNLTGRSPQDWDPRAAHTTRARLDLLREADHLVMEALRSHGVHDQVWQCPTVFIPVVVDGEAGELCVIRPIHSERAMTATAARLPQPLLAELVPRLLAVPTVVAVAYDLTSKPPGTIEWE